MNTTSVVNEIQRLNPDWTDTQILDVLNNVTKLLLKRESDASLYIDPATGDLPYLATTAGTLKYTTMVAGVDIWKVRCIVTDLDSSLALPDYPDWGRQYQQVNLLGRRYVTVPTAKVSDSDTLSVTFLVDPGTTTTTYRICGYVAPADILSLSVNIPIDDHFRYSVVVPAVQAVIDGLDNGRYVESMQYVEETLAPKLELDKDVQEFYTNNATY